MVVPVSIFVMDARLFPDEEPPLTSAVTRFTLWELITVIVPVSVVPVSFSVSAPNPASAADSVFFAEPDGAFTVFSVELVVILPVVFGLVFSC